MTQPMDTDSFTGRPLPAENPIVCPTCHVDLNYVGMRDFHEGTRWGALGELGGLFVNKEHFDVYVCTRCGRVTLFVDGIGEEFRKG
jgi:uncharacterized protein YbaR (Trm112 family)